MQKNEKNAQKYYHFTFYVQFLRKGVGRTEFFVILDRFSAFCQPNNRESQKRKKTPGGIILLHICTINENHIMYGSSDMEHDGQNFLSSWTIFCPFIPLTTQKNPNFVKMKKSPGDIIILHKSTKIMIICYTDPEIRCVTDVILFFISGYCLSFYPPDNSKNQNLKKMKNNSGR